MYLNIAEKLRAMLKETNLVGDYDWQIVGENAGGNCEVEIRRGTPPWAAAVSRMRREVRVLVDKAHFGWKVRALLETFSDSGWLNRENITTVSGIYSNQELIEVIPKIFAFLANEKEIFKDFVRKLNEITFSSHHAVCEDIKSGVNVVKVYATKDLEKIDRSYQSIYSVPAISELEFSVIFFNNSIRYFRANGEMYDSVEGVVATIQAEIAKYASEMLEKLKADYELMQSILASVPEATT